MKLILNLLGIFLLQVLKLLKTLVNNICKPTNLFYTHLVTQFFKSLLMKMYAVLRSFIEFVRFLENTVISTT